MNYQTYDSECEQAILSTIIMIPEKMKECTLEQKHFLVDTNKKIFTVFQKMYKETGTINLAKFTKLMKDEFACNDYLLKLVSMSVYPERFQDYIDFQLEHYKEFETMKLAQKLVEGSIETEAAVKAINDVYKEHLPNSDNGLLDIDEYFELITSDAEKLEFRLFNVFQSKIGILEKTVSLIAARPGVGKTSFALNLMNDLSRKYKCLYFNMEMTKKEIHQRLAAIESGLMINNFSSLNKIHQDDLKSSIKRVLNRKIKIFHGSKSLRGIRSIIAKEQQDEHVVIFIDHVGYVTTGKNQQNDTERIGEVVRELQLMTKDFDITMFLLCHINRSGTDTPNLNHLKDSGELEQSAHVVMILHNTTEDIEAVRCDVDILVLKNRSGRIGKMSYEFNKNTQIFEEKKYAR